MIWRAFLLVCGVNCINKRNPHLLTSANEATTNFVNNAVQDKVQEKLILSPKFNKVLVNNSLEMTCYNPNGSSETTWGTLNEANRFSHLYFLKEGVCTSDGFLADQTYFETRCYSNATFKVKIKRVDINYHGQEWFCSHKFITSNTAVISVLVPFKTLKIENHSGDALKVVEKMKTTLTCETSEGRPSANISWIKTSKEGISAVLTNDEEYNVSRTETQSNGNMIIVKSSIDITPIRDDNDTRIICEATNRKFNLIRKEVTLYVQYPPNKPVFFVDNIEVNGSLRIISGNNVSILCLSDSYPFPTYHWNSTRRSEYIGRYLSLFNITRNDTWQCTTKNSMILLDKRTIVGNHFAKLKLHVMLPTTKPVLFLEKENLELNQTLYVIRNDNVTILCRSDGDPVPKYQWLGLHAGAKLQITSVKKHTSKTCIASNSMIETVGNVQNSSSNTTVNIVVSNPPGTPFLHFTRQNDLAKNGNFLTNKVIIEENSSFTVTCNAEGYPPPKCRWNVFRAINSPRLTFINISKDAIGLYKCFAENLIKRSAPAYEVKMNTSTDLEIDVLYQSRIILFNIIGFEKNDVSEVTENKTITFNCIVDSNPEASIAISFRGKKLGHDVSAKGLLHTHRVTSCLDDGFYQCSAKNRFNSKTTLKELNLLVRCKPGVSPEFNLKSTVLTARNLTVTFDFKAIANPLPVFHWFKYNGSLWDIVKRSKKYSINTSGLYSNLSIRKITEDDYGSYKLRIENDFGYTEQLYDLRTKVSANKLHFNLSVYGLKGNKFSINKTGNISFMCFFDSDRPFDIAIRKHEGEQIVLVRNTTFVQHTIDKVSCGDAGEYQCSATNTSTKQQKALSNLILFVKCSPMPLPENNEDNIVLPVLHSDVNLQIKVHAYFDELNHTEFIWFKDNSSLLNDDSKYILSSKGFQSNLVIRNITDTDFGQYSVLVRNSYGQYIKLCELREKADLKIKQVTAEESTFERILLVVTVGTFGFVILVVVLAFIGYRHIRRERSEWQPNVEVNVNHTTPRNDGNNEHYEEINHVYDIIEEQNTEGAVYMEMRRITSEDSTKYYITPTI